MGFDHSLIPQKVKGIRWVLRKNGTILALNPYTDQYIEINKMGSLIWFLINGENSIGIIINTLLDLFKLPRQEIEEDVAMFIEKLVNSKLIEI